MNAFSAKTKQLQTINRAFGKKSHNQQITDESLTDGDNGAALKEAKNDSSNTIMQQINNFSLTPMNDRLAEQTIEDHKYLLELVENQCAIAFFAVMNRNQSLYNAM